MTLLGSSKDYLASSLLFEESCQQLSLCEVCLWLWPFTVRKVECGNEETDRGSGVHICQPLKYLLNRAMTITTKMHNSKNLQSNQKSRPHKKFILTLDYPMMLKVRQKTAYAIKRFVERAKKASVQKHRYVVNTPVMDQSLGY